MIENYFKHALRNLRNNKTYSAINIIGLAISLTACILLMLWVKDEISYDGFNQNAKNIYKISPQFTTEGKTSIWNGVPAPLATFGKKELPEVADACRIMDRSGLTFLECNNRKFYKLKCGMADASLFTLFNFPLISGNAKHPYTDDLSVILSETTVKKFFGTKDAIGQIIKGDDHKLYHVTGVMKDMPVNSSIKYDMVFNLDLMKRNYDGNGFWKSLDGDWGNYQCETYFLLQPNTNLKAVAQKLKDIHRMNHGGDPNSDFYKGMIYLLLPLNKMHLYSADGQEQGMKIVRIFFIVACVILLIACINYVNLVTARATKRAKEISLRKIIGAGKLSLFLQFLSEAIVIFIISLLFATILIYLVMPLYNDVAGKEMNFNPLSKNVLFIYGITFLATLILAGVYPAISLSAVKPLESMKGQLSGFGNKGSLRKVLVVVQFVFSIMLIISTIIISKQLKYLREKNLGYDKENIFYVSGLRGISDHYDAVKSDLLKQPGISAITASGENIMSVGSTTGDADWDGKTVSQGAFTIKQLSVERNFLKTMNVQLVEGNGFSGTPADSSNFILNETAISEMGLKDPVGKRFTFHDTKGAIVGVAKDFNFQNLHTKIEPILLYYNSSWHGDCMYVKTTGKDASKAIAAVAKIWKQYNPDYPYNYHFMDDAFNEIYKADLRTGELFNCFAIITIFISCLGLFGLVTYTAESKVKEIGVRKVLGASLSGIVNMLVKEFLKLVLIAIAIAFPASWWLLNKMLQDYSYHTGLSWWVFVLAGMITVIIALSTISFQAIKAALANPVKSLRTE